MCCSDICLLHHGLHRVCDPSSDGTWLLHSHLHAFEVPYHHEQGTLYSNGSSLMKMGLSQLIDTILAVHLPFCGKNVINHFVCEILAFLKLACTDISLNEITLMLGNVIFLFVPLLLISISYIFILSTVLRINSAGGRKKAFSTCSAHVTVVTMFYGSILFMYIKPKSKDTASDKLIALCYGVVTPMLNPIIYSLRNTEVHDAMKKLTARQFWKKGWGNYIFELLHKISLYSGDKFFNINGRMEIKDICKIIEFKC